MEGYAEEPDTAVAGLMKAILYVNNAPDKRTGIGHVLNLGNIVIGLLPPTLIKYAVSIQINQFGGYPSDKDRVPSIIFTVIFAILGIIHIVIFLINLSRGHYFYVSLAWVLYCGCRVCGFGLRAVWSTNVAMLEIGLTSEVLSIVSSIIIVSFNLILVQRLFTWRHPVGGSRKLFWAFMIILYMFVLILLGVTVTAAFVPYLNFLTTESFNKWQAVIKFTALMIIVYSLTSVALLVLSYWAPTRKDENLYTFQPWWIESFNTFYFVKKGAAQEAELTFQKREPHHRNATRVIAATMHHHNMIEGLSNNRGDLSHNLSICLIIFSSASICVSAVLRCITVFEARMNRSAAPLGNYVAMYLSWGALEALVNVAYIIWRVDLRFYRPDRLSAKVMEIITDIQMHLRDESKQDLKDESDTASNFNFLGDLYFDEITHDRFSNDEDSYLTDRTAHQITNSSLAKKFETDLSDEFIFSGIG